MKPKKWHGSFDGCKISKFFARERFSRFLRSQRKELFIKLKHNGAIYCPSPVEVVPSHALALLKMPSLPSAASLLFLRAGLSPSLLGDGTAF